MRSARHVERSHGAMGRALKKDLLWRVDRRRRRRCGPSSQFQSVGETVLRAELRPRAGMKLRCRSGLSCIHARRRSQYSHILLVVVVSVGGVDAKPDRRPRTGAQYRYTAPIRTATLWSSAPESGMRPRQAADRADPIGYRSGTTTRSRHARASPRR